MNWLFSLYVAILFFILTPAVLLRIPKNGSKYTVAAVHAIIFALLLHFTGKWVWNFSMRMEGFSEGLLTQAQATRKPDGIVVKRCEGESNAPTGNIWAKNNANLCANSNGYNIWKAGPGPGSDWTNFTTTTCTKTNATGSSCT
jgi:hypothetical protein